MMTAIYTISSALHDQQAVKAATKEFLDSLHLENVEFRGEDFSRYGSSGLDLIYVCTGGTEGIFLQLLDELLGKSDRPFYLLTSGKSNSLAASMEILSYLRQKGMRGEILHGPLAYVSKRIRLLQKLWEVRSALVGQRLGVLGSPSDWLISSAADSDAIQRRLGMKTVQIPMDEVMEALERASAVIPDGMVADGEIKEALPGAYRIYMALREVVEKHNLQGFTLRCFDLLTAVHNTGCLALARLNAEGIVAGCEGDVPALVSMMVAKAVTGVSGFQANPANIDLDKGEITFAHCTIPLNMVEHYELDTHFESGIGVGIRGFMKPGPVTVLNVSGDPSRYFVAECSLVENMARPNLCRTQQVIRLNDKQQCRYFLTNPIGNHHVILPGHHQELICEVLDNQ